MTPYYHNPLGLVLSLLVILPHAAAQQDQPDTANQVAVGAEACATVRGALEEAAGTLRLQRPALEQELAAIAARLSAADEDPQQVSTAEIAEGRQELAARRDALRQQLNSLESAATAWRSALDACESGARFRRELEQLESSGEGRSADVVPSDLTALEARFEQVRSTALATRESLQMRQKQLDDLDAPPESTPAAPTGGADAALQRAARAAVLAEIELTRQKMAAHRAEQDLLEAQLELVRARLGESASPSAAAPADSAATAQDGAVTGPPSKDVAAGKPVAGANEAEAQYKQRVAEQLDAEARDRLETARRRLEQIETDLATATGEAAVKLENDRALWKRRQEYEQRRLQLAGLQKRDAAQSEVLSQLQQRARDLDRTLGLLDARRADMTREQRLEQAEKHRQQAAELDKQAETVGTEAEADEKGVEPLQQLLPGLDAVEAALLERLRQTTGRDDVERLSRHIRRMRDQLEVERQQVTLMTATLKNIVYGKMRQAALLRELGTAQRRCADVLVPPTPSFWERNRRVFSSIAIVLFVVAASYLVSAISWILRRGLAALKAVTGRRLSVKRIGTLLTFATSIVKLFAWVFGAVAVLNEFGIDPAKSSGAIGLVGLIMAGMFQQIVIDFVKGLEIVAAGHYNVGDFIEVDGKFGHVVDFDVKHTRIRTLSGQEFNLPNSKCIPSRRFPDGYVDNFVEFELKSGGDESRARRAIDAVGPDINRRVEAVRGAPFLAGRFNGPRDGVVLRYCLRVVPGCDWVAKQHFIPAAREALAVAGVELAAEPYLFYMNRIETFRKLFNRQLSEEEILRDVAQETPTLESDSGERKGSDLD